MIGAENLSQSNSNSAMRASLQRSNLASRGLEIDSDMRDAVGHRRGGSMLNNVRLDS